MVSQDAYQVTIDTFQGPLDLLLYLIRRAEVDIHDIPIARITDQYLAFLNRIDSIDIDEAGEFLVLAATLVEIKSRFLMPPEDKEKSGDSAESAADEADPRFELVQQLLAYQRFRTASEALDARRIEFESRFTGLPARAERARLKDSATEDCDEPDFDLEDVHVLDLADAYEAIAAAIDFTRLGDHNVEFDDAPIELYQQDLIDRLSRRSDPVMLLQDAFAGQTQRQRVGLFLATLELVRQRRVTVTQPEIESPIEIALREDSDGPANDERESAVEPDGTAE